jgi:hypothetical protein
MSQQDYFEDMCKRCFIRNTKLTKKEIKKIVLSEERYRCSCCGKTDFIVEYVEE